MIKDFIEMSRSHRLKIAVVGDCMVDEWWSVDVERISPEAPVPVFKTSDWAPVSAAGGAGNVAAQLRHWNVDVDLFGILSPETEKMYRERFFLNTAKCAIHQKVLNPIKKRYMSGDVQVARIDQERDRCYLSENLLDALQHEIGDYLVQSDPDVIILSDYAKGVFSNGPHFFPMDHWKKQGKNVPIIVDPKKRPIEMWKGCTVYKPNEKEAAALSGSSVHADPKYHANYFADKLACESVVITHGAGGVTGVEKGEYFEYAVPWLRQGPATMLTPSREVKVKSVVGAGDCFVAFLAMAMGLGFKASEASRIAFEAGAIYVTHRFNSTVSDKELLASQGVDGKIVNAEDCWSGGVFTNGCFDVLHPGHLALLKYAKAFCRPETELVVGINSDASVKRLKGAGRPIHSQQDRAKMLAALEYVDKVVIFEEDTPYELIKKLNPALIVKGGDYKREDVVGGDLTRVVIFPTVAGHSTTNIVKGVANG